jgi:hypothetical protein
MKSVRERMDINAAYRDVGTYRGAADICGTTRNSQDLWIGFVG